jgi:hypothetical protein
MDASTVSFFDKPAIGLVDELDHYLEGADD